MHIKPCVIVILQISRVVKTVDIMENAYKPLRLCDISAFAEWQETIEIIRKLMKPGVSVLFQISKEVGTI